MAAKVRQLERHKFSSLFPTMSKKELAELTRDIAQHGLLTPITTYWDNGREYVLDGWNRYLAAQSAAHRFKPTDFDEFIGTPQEALLRCISHNYCRRHLERGQLAMIAIKSARMQEEFGTSRKEAIENAVKTIGASESTTNKAATILNADPVVAEEIVNGTQTINGWNENRRKKNIVKERRRNPLKDFSADLEASSLEIVRLSKKAKSVGVEQHLAVQLNKIATLISSLSRAVKDIVPTSEEP